MDDGDEGGGGGRGRHRADAAGIEHHAAVVVIKLQNMFPLQEKGPLFVVKHFIGRQVHHRWVYLHLAVRSEEHTSELQSLMRISYAVFCLKKNTQPTHTTHNTHTPLTT